MIWLFVVISCIIFLIYNVIIQKKYDFQTSLSATYYSFPNNFRWVFTIFMCAIALLILPAWIEISNSFEDWRSYLRFMPFLTCAGICFVGVAPNFRAFPMESKVHTISAMIAAVAALLWCCICGYQYWYIILTFLICPITIMFVYDKNYKQNLTYWLEMIAFSVTYGMLLKFMIEILW